MQQHLVIELVEAYTKWSPGDNCEIDIIIIIIFFNGMIN